MSILVNKTIPSESYSFLNILLIPQEDVEDFYICCYRRNKKYLDSAIDIITSHLSKNSLFLFDSSLILCSESSPDFSMYRSYSLVSFHQSTYVVSDSNEPWIAGILPVNPGIMPHNNAEMIRIAKSIPLLLTTFVTAIVVDMPKVTT